MSEPRCATAARHRGDPWLGTAAPTSRWLLVEHPVGWAPAALRSAGIPPPLGQRLDRAALAVGGRVLLIRRPGRRHRPTTSPPPARRWAVVLGDGSQRWGSWQDPADLDEPLRLFEHPAAASPEAATGGDTAPDVPSPLLLVCTHGRHDTCCAVRGRPLAQALADRWPELVWECTHIGGDRFAANLLVLPDGTVYGGLDPHSGVAVVGRHLAGIVDTVHLRGFSSAQPPVQAALGEVLRRFGPAGPNQVSAGRVDRAANTRGLVVEVLGRRPVPGRVLVQVDRVDQPPALLTCHATRPTSAPTWVPTILEVTA